jgi:hypothetical protein
MLREPIGLFGTLFFEGDAVLCECASTRRDRRQRRTRNNARGPSASSTAAQRVLLTVGSARLKFVAEFLNETEKEDLMKYLLLIATLAAFIGASTAMSLAADCCKANARCCPGKCCKK